MKSIIKLIILSIIFVFILFTFFIPNDYAECDISDIDAKECPKADAIVVVSGGDTKARTEYGAELYGARLAPKIILSGAAFDPSSPSNAEEMAEIAIKAGVLNGDVLIETESRNTRQNAQFVKEAIDAFGFKKIILVTSAYHQRRANYEFKKSLGNSIAIYNAPLMNDKHWSQYTWWLNTNSWFLAYRELGGLALSMSGLRDND